MFKENETLAILGDISLKMTELLDGKFDLQFKDTSLASHAGPLSEKDKETYCYIIIPTTSWNLMQQRLRKLVSIEDRRLLGTGRAYRVLAENLITKQIKVENKEILRFVAKLDFTYDPKRYEFRDALYFGYCSRCWEIKEHSHHSQDLDTKKYPLVVATLKAWDLFQHLIDRLQIREEMRKNYPVCLAIKNKEVFKVSNQWFENARSEKNKLSDT